MKDLIDRSRLDTLEYVMGLIKLEGMTIEELQKLLEVDIKVLYEEND